MVKYNPRHSSLFLLPVIYSGNLFGAISDFLPGHMPSYGQIFLQWKQGHGKNRACLRPWVTSSQDTGKYSCSLDFASAIPILSRLSQTQPSHKAAPLWHFNKDKRFTS